VRRTPRILIVEDEFLFVMELDNGFQVLGPAANVSTALTLLRAERPDAAVLDVNLAGEWVTPVGRRSAPDDDCPVHSDQRLLLTWMLNPCSGMRSTLENPGGPICC